VYSPLGVGLAVSLMLFAAGYTLINLDQFVVRIKQESLESFFSWSTLAWLWVALGVSKVVHEFGHGLTCKHFGGECHEMGVLFLVFTPCMYCDTTDAWTMPNKWHRIAISAGGIYVELIIASIATLIWWHTAPGTLHTIAFALMTLCSLSTFLVNANPLMRYDGYYILADLMEIPNLRQKSAQAMQSLVDRYVLGLGASSVPQVTGRKTFFITYAILAWLYRWLLCAVILWFFYNLLKPYRLGSLSVALAIVVGAQMVVLPIWKNAMRVKNTVRTGQPVRWGRALASAVVLGAVMAAIVFVPIPRRVWGVLTVEGADQQPVFVPVTGRVEEIAARPGETVEQGAVLVRMSSTDLDLQIQRLEHRLRAIEVAAEKFFALGKPGEEQSLQVQRDEILKELNNRRQQRDRLTIRAETAGTVVAAPRQKEQKITSRGYDALVDWRDQPLSPQNVGAQFPIGTMLCELQPRDEYEAVLLVEQSDIAFLNLGQPVSVKLDAFPAQTFVGQVTDIGAVEAEHPPEQLLVTKGGELAAEMQPDGSVGLQSTHYEVRASIEGLKEQAEANPHAMLRYGLRGRAKIVCGQWTCWDIIVRELNQLFHF
jgi:putative peptide zinc metalloprotease protein